LHLVVFSTTKFCYLKGLQSSFEFFVVARSVFYSSITVNFNRVELSPEVSCVLAF